MTAFSDAHARRITRDLTTPRKPQRYGRCGFCGTPCYGPTCRSHRDLLALDPNTAKGVANLIKESTEGSRQVRPDGAPLRRRQV